ncbi:MAG: hypothetical protein ACK4UP_05160 [Spirosomataceae bacterium]
MRLSILLFFVTSLLAHGQDTLRPIAPKGYVLLSYDGARLVLKTKVEADACFEQLQKKDTLLALHASKLIITESEKKRTEQALALEKARVKELKKKVVNRNVEAWTYRAALVLFALKSFNLI